MTRWMPCGRCRAGAGRAPSRPTAGGARTSRRSWWSSGMREKAEAPKGDVALSEARPQRARTRWPPRSTRRSVDTIITTERRRSRETAAPLASSRHLTPVVVPTSDDTAAHAPSRGGGGQARRPRRARRRAQQHRAGNHRCAGRADGRGDLRWPVRAAVHAVDGAGKAIATHSFHIWRAGSGNLRVPGR